MGSLIYIFLFGCIGITFGEIENAKWQKDIGNEMHIGTSFKGYSQAVIECSADWIAFVVSLEEDFNGVVYTRGNFYKREGPCFLKAAGGKDFALKLPYDDCGIKHDSDESGYVTTVIVQHDEDLIMPGDLAFRLICRDEAAVGASLEGMRSKITLVDPDPSGKSTFDGALSAMSPSNIATLQSVKISFPKEEL